MKNIQQIREQLQGDIEVLERQLQARNYQSPLSNAEINKMKIELASLKTLLHYSKQLSSSDTLLRQLQFNNKRIKSYGYTRNEPVELKAMRAQNRLLVRLLNVNKEGDENNP